MSTSGSFPRFIKIDYMTIIELPVQILVFNRIPLEENKGLKYPFGVETFQQKYVDYLL